MHRCAGSRRLRCASWGVALWQTCLLELSYVLDERLLGQPRNSIDDDAFEGTKWHR
eukprot:EC786434.1.p3 GENE.EC786434.1~~EC786434.1.p3  ORF type:complete len:56 (+),score=3.20 EC786434.1:236-403(+)